MVAAALLSLFVPIMPSPPDCGAKSDADERTAYQLHVAVWPNLIALQSLLTLHSRLQSRTRGVHVI